MFRYYFRRLKKSQRGAAIIEFAIVVPVLLLLLLGIIEFGWIFNSYITLTGSAREGARLAVVGEDDAAIRAAVRNHATAFTLADGDIVISPSTGQGNERMVAVTGDVSLLTGLFDGVTLSAKATMRQEIGTVASNGGGNDTSNGNDNGDDTGNGETGPTECTGPPSEGGDCTPGNPCDYCNAP